MTDSAPAPASESKCRQRFTQAASAPEYSGKGDRSSAPTSPPELAPPDPLPNRPALEFAQLEQPGRPSTGLLRSLARRVLPNGRLSCSGSTPTLPVARPQLSPSGLADEGAPPTRTGVLLARYLTGDRAAGERLFSRFRATLLARARAHPLMRPLAGDCSPEDVVHEVFWRALASGLLRDFEDRGHGSLEAALAKVLDNTLVDLARRRSAQKRGGGCARVEPRSDGRDVLERVASDDTSPTAKARSAELVTIARAALAPREFEVWQAIELDGADSVELAERLGTSSSAVRGVLRRALAKLMAELERRRTDLRS